MIANRYLYMLMIAINIMRMIQDMKPKEIARLRDLLIMESELLSSELKIQKEINEIYGVEED